MSDRVTVTLTNAETLDVRLSMAITELSGQAFAFKLAWAIADIQDAVEKQLKKHQQAVKNLFKTHGAQLLQNGNYAFDAPIGDKAKDEGKVIMPQECREELERLANETMEHELDLIELPLTRKVNGKDETIEYKPIIFIGLRKFIQR